MQGIMWITRGLFCALNVNNLMKTRYPLFIHEVFLLFPRYPHLPAPSYPQDL